MTPDEAVEAATLGGAKALRRTDIGHLGPGGPADAVLLEAPSHIHLAYRPGVPLVSAVWREAGNEMHGAIPVDTSIVASSCVNVVAGLPTRRSISMS